MISNGEKNEICLRVNGHRDADAAVCIATSDREQDTFVMCKHSTAGYDCGLYPKRSKDSPD